MPPLPALRCREPLQPGLLWVVEQLPGFIQAEDVTSILTMGYWPSFNVAWFPEVWAGGTGRARGAQGGQDTLLRQPLVP
jgi:hypothetical protein